MRRYLTVSQTLGIPGEPDEDAPAASFTTQLDALHTSGGGLVAHWPMGSDLTERLGGLTLTAGGTHETGLPALAAGGVASRGFNGISSYAHAPFGSPNITNSALVTAAGTIGVVIQADDTLGKMNICNLTDDGPGGVSLELLTGGVPRAFRENTSSTPVIISGGQLIRGRPYLYALTWGAGGLLLYLMGADRAPGLVASNVAATDWTPGVASGQDLYVGRWHNQAVDHYDGLLSHLFWFSRQLTIAELQSLAVLVQQVAYLPSFNFGQVDINATTPISLENRGHPPFDFTLERTTPNPTLGTATVNGTSVDYAAGGALGADSFGVILTTAEGLAADPCTVSLSVVPPPTPVAHPDSFGPVEAGSSTDLDVLANDENVSDFDIAIVSQPAAGSLTRVSNATAGAKLNFSAPNPATQTTYTGSYSVDGSNVANVSITVNALSAGGDEISIPSLTSFLANDGSLPSAPIIYVYDTQRGNGSGSDAENAKEIQAAINAATAGQNLVAIALTPGGTSYYDRENGLTWTSANNGTSGSKITLSARPGDTVVISRGEAFADARTAGSGFWESTAWDSSKKIWRSAAATYGSARELAGQWVEFGVPHQIPRYANLTDLSKPVGTADMPTNYGGPGAVVHTDGRVYIRMQKPHPAKYSVANKWPSDGRLFDAPGEEVVGGQLAFPVTENPNSYPIFLAEYSGDATDAPGFNLVSRSHWTIGDGINSLGFGRVIHPGGSSNIAFGRGLHLTTRLFIAIGSGTASNYTFNRTRISIGSPRHLSFVEFKFGQAYWENNSRGSVYETAGSSTLSNFHFLDCTMHGFFDWCVGGAPGGHKFIRCAIVDTMDDGIQHNPQTLANVEIGWCYFLFAGYDGPGGGSGGNVAGAWFIHHNIMDYRALRVTNNATQPHPMSLTQHHSQNANRPAKVFNNTAITMTDTMDQQRIPFEHINRANNHPTIAHECFNNIMLVVNGDVGFSTRYTPASNFPGQSDGCIRGARTTDNSIYTYNLYWRDPALAPYVRGIVQLDGTYYSSISAARSAKPAFEPNGNFEIKPSIPSIDNYPADKYKYRPTAVSAVTTAYTNQSTSPAGESMASWPAATADRAAARPSAWKGALDPNGSTMTVGPQDP